MRRPPTIVLATLAVFTSALAQEVPDESLAETAEALEQGVTLFPIPDYKGVKISDWHFTYQLPMGRHTITYRIRAEIPGRFSALPAKASAMYAPELKGNSDEAKLVIQE